jgi:hypothetical protein
MERARRERDSVRVGHRDDCYLLLGAELARYFPHQLDRVVVYSAYAQLNISVDISFHLYATSAVVCAVTQVTPLRRVDGFHNIHTLAARCS